MRLMLFLLLFVFMLSFVYAQVPGTSGYRDKVLLCSSVALNDTVKCCLDKGFDSYDSNLKLCTFNFMNNRTIMRENVQSRVANVSGLSNAMLRVRNDAVAIHLLGIMNKIQEPFKVRLSLSKNVTFDVDNQGTVIVSGNDYALFLGFIKSEHKYYCRVLEDGSLRKKVMFFDIFFKEHIGFCEGVKIVLPNVTKTCPNATINNRTTPIFYDESSGYCVIDLKHGD